MTDRPELNTALDASTFRHFYYRKEELVAFCRANGLPTAGGKIELTERIAHYLSTGQVLPRTTATRRSANVEEITAESIIEPDIVCSEKHRAFFREVIGRSFSFHVGFQKWLKANPGKTYAQAVEAYYQILAEKKNKKPTIDKQFEYNTYIRDYFADQPKGTLQQAIACWKYKKGLPGHNRYETSDLLLGENSIHIE